MKKNVVSSLIFMLTLSFIAGCGGTPAKTETAQTGGGEIQFLLTYPKEKTAFYEAIDHFQKESGIKVDVMYLPLKDAEKQISIMAASNKLPDVMDVDSINTPAYASMGILADLTPYIQKDVKVDEYYQPTLDSSKYNGKYYGMPFTSATLGLFYNKDMFKAAGIANPPATWDELQQDLVKLSKNGVYGFSLAGNRTSNSSFVFLPFLLQNGGKTTAVGDKATADSLKFYKSMIDNNQLSREMANWSLQDALDQFKAQKSAMTITGPFALPQVIKEAKFDWGTAPLPAGPGGKGTILSGHNLVAANNKNIEASWKFIKYMNQRDVMMKYSEVENYIPARKDMTEHYKKGPIAPFVESMQFAVPRGPLVKWPQYDDVLQKMVQEVAVGVKTPEQASTDAAAAATKDDLLK